MKKITSLLLGISMAVPVAGVAGNMSLAGISRASMTMENQIGVTISENIRLAEVMTEYRHEQVVDNGFDPVYTLVTYPGVTSLKIKGELMAADYETLLLMNEVTVLDLSEAMVEGNMIPANALSQTDGFYSRVMQSLETLILPASLRSIGMEAFNQTTTLRSVNLGELGELVSVGAGALSGTGLVSVEIPAKCISFDAPSVLKFCEQVAQITVNPANTKYVVEGNIMYDKVSSEMVYFPKGSMESEIVIRQGTTLIPDNAFENNYNITKVTLPASVRSIGASAFSYAAGLAEINLPEGLESIGYLSFQGCSLSEVVLPQSLRSLEMMAFAGNHGLKSVTMGENIEYIYDGVFMNCTALESVTAGSLGNLKEMGSEVMSGCQSLKSMDLSGATGLSKLPDMTFMNCTSLESVRIPSNMVNIGASAFDGCQSLEFEKFPENLRNIGEYAFRGNMSLSYIYIGKYMESIGEGAFENCVNMVPEVDDNEVCFLEDGIIWSLDLTHIYYVSADMEPADGELNLSKLSHIGNGLFANNDKIRSVIFGSDLESIGKDAFNGVSGVSMIDLGKSTKLKSIGEGAFAGMSSLAEIVLPENSETDELGTYLYQLNIGNGAFENSGLRSIVMPEQTGFIGDAVFRGAMELERADFTKAKISMFGQELFKDCRSLVEFRYNQAYPYDLGYNMFEGCVALEEIALPDMMGSWSVDGAMFASTGVKRFVVSDNNLDLASVEGSITSKDGSKLMLVPNGTEGTYMVPESVTAIAPKAFFEIQNLEKVVINEGLGEAYYNGSWDMNVYGAFYNLPSLAAFEVADGNGYYTVANGALYSKDMGTLISYPAAATEVVTDGRMSAIGAYALNGVNFGDGGYVVPAGVESVGYRAFFNSNLESVELPESVVSLNGAFGGCYGLAKVTSLAKVVPAIDYSTFDGCDPQVLVPADMLDAYMADMEWSMRNLTVITSIVDNVADNGSVVVVEGNEIIAPEDAVMIEVYGSDSRLIGRSASNRMKVNGSGIYLVKVRFADEEKVVKIAIG